MFRTNTLQHHVGLGSQLLRISFEFALTDSKPRNVCNWNLEDRADVFCCLVKRIRA